MKSEVNSAGDARSTRRTVTELKAAMRDLRVQLSLLNHHVGAQADLKDADLDCLDLISIYAPISPSALAKRAGLHPATMTGILDRLERGGWVARERDVNDRRAIVIRVLPERNREMYRLYAGMDSLMDEICDGYDNDQLNLITEFFRRVTGAGQVATERFEA